MAEAKKLNVLVICGSLRKGSMNKAVARTLPELAPANMSIKDAPPFDAFPLYNADHHQATVFPAAVTALADAIHAADGVIIVSPEYNFSVPGALKNAIDWVSRPYGAGALKGTPLAVIGTSLGQYGGVWAHDETRKSFSAAGARLVVSTLGRRHQGS